MCGAGLMLVVVVGGWPWVEVVGGTALHGTILLASYLVLALALGVDSDGGGSGLMDVHWRGYGGDGIGCLTLYRLINLFI